MSDLRPTVLVVGALCCSCGPQQSSDTSFVPDCGAVTERVGTWRAYQYPTEEAYIPETGETYRAGIMTTDAFVYDGRLQLVEDYCDKCTRFEADPDSGEWTEVMEHTGLGFHPTSALAHTGRYVAIQGATLSPEPQSIDTYVIDLEQPEASHYPLPAVFEGHFVETLTAVGEYVAVWSHSEAPWIRDDDSVITVYYDGGLLDPATGAWEEIPELVPPVSFVLGEESWLGQFAIAGTSEALFAWGVEAPGEDPILAKFVPGSGWERLEQDTLPPARVRHRLLASADSLYLFSGTEPRVGEYRRGAPELWDLWRYSFSEGDWERIDVPNYVDLASAQGAILDDGRVVFAGRVCIGAAVYEPGSGSWSRTHVEEAPNILDDDGRVQPFHVTGTTLYQVGVDEGVYLDYVMFQLTL